MHIFVVLSTLVWGEREISLFPVISRSIFILRSPAVIIIFRDDIFYVPFTIWYFNSRTTYFAFLTFPFFIVRCAKGFLPRA